MYLSKYIITKPGVDIKRVLLEVERNWRESKINSPSFYFFLIASNGSMTQFGDKVATRAIIELLQLIKERKLSVEDLSKDFAISVYKYVQQHLERV